MEIHFLELKLFLFVSHLSGFTGILHLSLDALDHYLLVARANLAPLTGDNLMNSSYKDLGLKLAEKCPSSRIKLVAHSNEIFIEDMG